MDWAPLFLRDPSTETPSRFALFFTLIYVLLIAGVSLYPFSGWQRSPDYFAAFLFYPWPIYFTGFDILINVLAYVPLGMGLASFTKTRLKAVGGILLVALIGGLLSLGMELLQDYLPDRFPSKLDLSCNLFGAILGGFLVFTLDRHPFWRYFRLWRARLLYTDTLADYGLAVIVLWFFTQLDPAVPLFGVVVHPQGLPQPFVAPIDNAALFLQLLEASGACLHLVGVGWLAATVLRRARHGLGAIFAFVALALVVKLVFAGMLLKPTAFFEWVNPPVAAGWLAGMVFFVLLRRLKRIWQAFLAMLALVGGMLVGELWPLHVTPVGNLTLFKWTFGQLGHFKGLVNLVAAVWPYLALIYLALLVFILLRKNPNELPF